MNIKHFTFRFESSNYKGFNLVYEKNKFDVYSKLKFSGFNIDYIDRSSKITRIMYYNISDTIIRMLKLKKIENSLNQSERNLLELMEKSKITDEKTNQWYKYFKWSTTTTTTYDRLDYTEEPKPYTLNKQYLKYQSKMSNNKIKQYENKRFRK